MQIYIHHRGYIEVIKEPIGHSGPRITKRYEFVRPIVYHRLIKFVEQKSLVQTFVKGAPDLLCIRKVP